MNSTNSTAPTIAPTTATPTVSPTNPGGRIDDLRWACGRSVPDNPTGVPLCLRLNEGANVFLNPPERSLCLEPGSSNTWCYNRVKGDSDICSYYLRNTTTTGNIWESFWEVSVSGYPLAQVSLDPSHVEPCAPSECMVEFFDLTGSSLPGIVPFSYACIPDLYPTSAPGGTSSTQEGVGPLMFLLIIPFVVAVAVMSTFCCKKRPPPAPGHNPEHRPPGHANQHHRPPARAHNIMTNHPHPPPPRPSAPPPVALAIPVATVGTSVAEATPITLSTRHHHASIPVAQVTPLDDGTA